MLLGTLKAHARERQAVGIFAPVGLQRLHAMPLNLALAKQVRSATQDADSIEIHSIQDVFAGNVRNTGLSAGW